MKNFRNISVVLLTALVIFFAGCAQFDIPTAPAPTENEECRIQGVSGSFETYYNQPPSSKDIDAKVVNFISSATSTVDVAIFNINRQCIVDALIAKKRQGKNVRVVTEADYYNNANYKPFYNQLQAAGITVVPDIGTALMHHKFIVVDGTKVLTGTYNFTDDQTFNDKNMIVIIKSSSLANFYTQEFNQMFVEKKFHGYKTHISGSCYVDGCLVQVYFSPKVGALTAMKNAIATANSNVWFDIFTFTADDISASLIARKNAGVSVKGTFDKWQAGSSYSEYLPMKNAGCLVKRDTYSGFLHEKIMSIDAYTSSDPIGIIGSFNWTASADSSNDENLLIIHNSFIANSIRGQCVYVYNNYAE
ncbi:MAG: phospholipase D-like domain-containing protein [bacterium]|nr:phospholipase D-like domain-containing protein [bacterium]